jgi:hypothetical protein
MLRAVVALNLAGSLVFVASGCGKSTIREYESQACSTNDSDDPFLLCSPAYDLICINTYSVTVQNPKEAAKWDGGVRPVYVCRIACATTSECIQAGDVCCPGAIHGKDYEKKAGCAPRGMCEALRGTGEDAGLGTLDGGADDAPVDSPPAPRPDGGGVDEGPSGGLDAHGPEAGGLEAGGLEAAAEAPTG